MPLRLLGAGLAASLVFTACGDDDGDDDSESEESSQEASDDSQQQEAEDQQDDSGGGEVPDPCSLVPSEELSGILGGDPGAATPNAVDPEQRKICTYASGLVLGVQRGGSSDYETAVGIYEGEWGPMEDVSGVGNEAKWLELEGGVGSFIALGDEYFVDITVVVSAHGGQEAAGALAQAMLDAL